MKQIFASGLGFLLGDQVTCYFPNSQSYLESDVTLVPFHLEGKRQRVVSVQLIWHHEMKGFKGAFPLGADVVLWPTSKYD